MMPFKQRDRLYINACGLHVPIGRNVPDVVSALSGKHQDYFTIDKSLLHNQEIRVGAVEQNLPPVIINPEKFDSRNNRLMQSCLVQIEAEVKDAVIKYGADRVAVIMGTSTSGISNGEDALSYRKRAVEWPNDFDYTQQEITGLSQFVSRYFKILGPAYTVATACSSSAKVFASARRLIESDIVDAAIVGGADTLCKMTLNGFKSLDLLSKTQCNPFSANRDGITIGEGAAVFLLSKEKGPVELLGVGETSDAYHQTSPHPEGIGAQKAMMLALEDAELLPDKICYINLHGTATRHNDSMESHAVFNVFGKDVPCSSTKSMTGHMLGAAGACEAAFLWILLNPKIDPKYLPPHIWDGVYDEELSPINLLGAGHAIPKTERRYMLSNSFGFGGSNVSLIFGDINDL